MQFAIEKRRGAIAPRRQRAAASRLLLVQRAQGGEVAAVHGIQQG